MMRQVILPGAGLTPYVRNFMFGRFFNLENHLPATPHSQLVVYLKGGAVLDSGRQERFSIPKAFVAGPSLAPYTFRVQPGSEFIAATFRPGGFMECLGLPANACSGQLVPLEHVIAHEEVEAFLERLYGARGIEQAIDCIEVFLFAMKAKEGRRHAALPVLSLEQMWLPAPALARTFEIGTRQFERRFLSTYGLPLRDYRRLARFSMALSQVLCGAENGTRIAQDANYFDQAHFSRDFHEFVGSSPGRFIKERQQEDSIYRFWQLNQEELRSYMDDRP